MGLTGKVTVRDSADEGGSDMWYWRFGDGGILASYPLGHDRAVLYDELRVRKGVDTCRAS